MNEPSVDWSLDGEAVQALIDSLPVGVLHWDARRDPFYISNPAARLIIGASLEGPFPARGSGLGGMVEPDRSRVAEALKRGEPFDGTVEVATPGGEVRHLELRVRGTPDRGWSITRLVPEPTVSETGEHSPAPGGANPRFSPLFEHSRVAMFLLDATGLVLTTNPVGARLLGRESISELLAHRFDMRDFLTDEAIREALLAELSTHGYVAGREVAVTRKDGSQTWVLLDLAVNPTDGFIEMVATDIAQERSGRLALEASEQRFRGIFENAVVGVIQMTTDGALVAANAYAARIFGYDTAEEFIAGWPLNHLHAANELRAEVDRLGSAPSHESSTEHQILSVDGTERWIRVVSRLDAATATVDAFIRDISAERAAQAESARLIHELDVRATERRQLVRRLLHAGEEERRQVAHEIHDGPVQLLAGSLMFLTSAQQERERGRTEQAEDYLERGTEYLRTALGEMRRVMAHLRPAVLDDLGLVSAIRSAAEAAVAPYEMSARVEQFGDAMHLDQATEMVLFRVAQEATTNAGKHSNGRVVRITLDYRDAEVLTLTVTDDGEGFDTEAAFAEADGHHLGLLGLQERVYLVGGHFSIESAPEHGTRISVVVPRSPVAP